MSPQRQRDRMWTWVASRAPVLVALLIVVAGFLVWNFTRSVELIEGESVIELDDVEPAGGQSVEPVTLNDHEQRLPTLRISNATLLSSEISVRHGYELFPVYETAIVESTNVWSVRPEEGVSQDDAVERVVSQTKSQLTKMLQRDMKTELFDDTGNTLILPKSQPGDDNPYWFTSTIGPADDGTIQISITLDTRPPGSFEYTADDLVHEEYLDKVALVEPLTAIDGILLYDFTITDRSGLRLELNLEHDNEKNFAHVDCDEFAEAFVKVADALQQYDPTVVRDTEAFDGATLGVDGERSTDGGKLASFYDGEAIRFGTLTTCLPTNSLALGSVLTVNFWPEGFTPSS